MEKKNQRDPLAVDNSWPFWSKLQFQMDQSLHIEFAKAKCDHEAVYPI